MKEYPKELRLRARHNWAALEMTDEENATSIGLLNSDGSPNFQLISLWRSKSRNPNHRYNDENWDKYREEILRQREFERAEAMRIQSETVLKEMIGEAEALRIRKLKTFGYIEGVIISEISPKDFKNKETGITEKKIQPNVALMKAFKLASDILGANFDNHTKTIIEYFKNNKADDNEISWQKLLEDRYAATELEQHDPAMSKNFYEMDEEQFDEFVSNM